MQFSEKNSAMRQCKKGKSSILLFAVVLMCGRVLSLTNECRRTIPGTPHLIHDVRQWANAIFRAWLDWRELSHGSSAPCDSAGNRRQLFFFGDHDYVAHIELVAEAAPSK